MSDIRERMLVEHETYETAFLSVDAANHVPEARSHEVAIFMAYMDEYHALIREITERFGGYEWNWAGDGGLCVFLGESCRQAATMAGMHIINTWPLLAFDTVRNPSSIALPLRVAASAGPMVYREPRNTVLADSINRAVHLQEDATDPDEFTLDESLFDHLSSRLQWAFRFKEVLDSTRVFRYLPQIPGRRPDDEEVDGLIARVKDQVEELLQGYIPTEALLVGSATISKILYHTEEVYGDIRRFSRWFEYPEKIWSEKYFRRVASFARQLSEIEGRLYRRIHDWLGRLSPHDTQNTGLLPLSKRIASLHGTDIEVGLVNLEQRLNGFAAEASCQSSHDQNRGDSAAAAAREPSKELKAVAHHFVAADEMGALANFAPLISRPREELHAVISNTDFPEHDALIQRLGSMPDLILTEDLGRGIRAGGKGGLFALLRGSWAVGKRLDVLASLLNQEDLYPGQEEIGRIFRIHEIEAGPPETAGIQRAIIIAHSKPEIREKAVSAIVLDELWQAAAYQGTPIAALLLIARRLPDWSDDHLKMIFFDCIKDRLVSAICSMESPQQLRELQGLLGIFIRFECFTASPYFFPLAESVTSLCRKARDLGKDVKLAGWEEFVAKHNSGVYEEDPQPRVDLLPVPVQRYLAQLGRYPLMFACSSHDHVAHETTKHINSGNISLFLRQKQINRTLLATLMRRQDLFSRAEPLLLVLTHPRCHPGYAWPYLNRLNRTQINHVLSSRTANTEVHRKAQELKDSFT